MDQEYTKGKLNYTLLTNKRIRKDLQEALERTIKECNNIEVTNYDSKRNNENTFNL